MAAKYGWRLVVMLGIALLSASMDGPIIAQGASSRDALFESPGASTAHRLSQESVPSPFPSPGDYGWKEADPFRKVGSSTSVGNIGGRFTSLATPVDKPGVLFAGAAGGGVWRSLDSGHSWMPLSDEEPTLAVGALALDPKDDNTLYVATGNNWLGFGSLPGEGIRYPTTHWLDSHTGTGYAIPAAVNRCWPENES